MDFIHEMSKSEIIGLFAATGTWLAAFGTLAAVIVAIRLAKPPPPLEVWPLSSRSDDSYISIENLTHKKISILALYFSIGILRKKTILVPGHFLSPDHTQYVLKREEGILYTVGEPNWNRKLIDWIGHNPLWTLRIIVVTPTKRIKIKPDPVSLQRLKKSKNDGLPSNDR